MTAAALRCARLGWAVVVGTLAAILMAGAPASAHNELTAAEPAKGATLTAAPVSVVLTFGQQLKAGFVTIVVTDAARQRVAAGEPVVAGAKVSVTLTGPLRNGPYLVAYRAVSVDGHSAQGSYQFTVADPALPAAGVTSPATEGRHSGGWSAGPLALAAAGVVVLLAGAALLASHLRLRRLKRRADQPEVGAPPAIG